MSSTGSQNGESAESKQSTPIFKKLRQITRTTSSKSGSDHRGPPSFAYEPLDLSSKPSIRLAVLLPGHTDSVVKIKLMHKAFADRPKYKALSYTWGNPKVTKSIEIDYGVVKGTKVDIRTNLWSALVHLRSFRYETVLWIDAVCINQADIDERNRQVRLMSHIFARADEVLIWLGTFPLNKWPDAHETLSGDVPRVEMSALCNAMYWRRIWIVQEIGAANSLRVHWHSFLNSTLSQPHQAAKKSLEWDQLFAQLRRDPPPNADLALRLAAQRDGRHGDSFLLANLMEVCKNSLCEEPRDKVYGLFGIAHDCEDGSLEIDYAAPLYSLFEDVVRFQYRSAASRADFRSVPLNEKTLVNFSQMTLSSLGGSYWMQQDLLATQTPFESLPSFNRLESKSNFFKVRGAKSGTILTLGPSYSDIVGIPEAARTWRLILSRDGSDIERLRKKSEGFMRVLLNLNRTDLDKVCSIEPLSWWDASIDSGVLENIINPLKAGSQEAADLRTAYLEVDPEPRLFLCKSGVMGLVPSNAREGDMIVQFWNSDAVAVVRQDDHRRSIVGRAVVANEGYSEGSKFHIPLDYIPDACEDGLWLSLDPPDPDYPHGEHVYLDICTLRLLTQ